MMATARVEWEDPSSSSSSNSRSERVIERFQAILAGLLELEVLRAKQKQAVDMALGRSSSTGTRQKNSQAAGSYQNWLEEGNFSRLGLSSSLSEGALDDLQRCGTVQSWSRRSADEDLLLDSTGHRDEGLQAQVPWDCSNSRTSSGFCDDDQSEMYSSRDERDLSFLSNSVISLTSRTAPEVNSPVLGNIRLIMMKKRPGGGQNQSLEDNPAGSSHVIPRDGFLSVANLCPDSLWPDVSEIVQPQVVLESQYRSDLHCHQGTEVYRYPSPLHAVALQSPLYTPESTLRQTRAFTRGSTPKPVYFCSQSVFVGIRSDSFFLPAAMSTMLPGHTCQMFPHVPCERHRLEAFIIRLAQRHKIPKSPLCLLPGTPGGSPACSLRRTCSMGKSRSSDQWRMLRNLGKAGTATLDCTSMSSSVSAQVLKRPTYTSRSRHAHSSGGV